MKINTIKHIIKPETELENQIINDVDFIRGSSFGRPRHGHPEGEVIYHIKEVLANIDKYDFPNREALRLIAITHDTFKYMVDRTKPKVGYNHHGMYARKFAEKYIENSDILFVIEHHDDAYNAWSMGDRNNQWNKAEQRANDLIRGLLIEGNLDLYVNFFRCDNETGNKSQDCIEWFNKLIR